MALPAQRPGAPAPEPSGGAGRQEPPDLPTGAMAALDARPTPRGTPPVGSDDRPHDARGRWPQAPGRRSFRSRYAVVYQTDGPRVRFGVGWALLVAAALAYPSGRSVALAGLFAVAAGSAAHQVVIARGGAGARAARLGAVGAGAITLASIAGARGTCLALLVFVLVAAAVAATDRAPGETVAASAGHLVLWASPPGVASAAVVLTLRYQIGAVITLLVLVAVYEASDYVIGSGASNPFEGPLAGTISIAVVTFIVAQLRVPPFGGNDAWAFGALAVTACPLGQLAASALLPAPDAPAPALRRLDSLLVLAPLWSWLIGLYLIRVR